MREMSGFIMINDRLSPFLTPLERKRAIVQRPHFYSFEWRHTSVVDLFDDHFVFVNYLSEALCMFLYY